MADTTFTNATQILEPFKGVKKVTLEEYFTSGHRTCQGCESALVMKLMVKAAGPRTIVLGSTGCMYVANTTYYTTPWVVPWMHTQLGSSGSAALGTAAGLKALMKKGKMKSEPINVIAFCGDGGGADMGLGAISATLTHKEYNSLILIYDNESYANTDIQLSGSTPYGANTTFSPPGSVKRIIHTRWKKNTAGMLAAGHPECRYVATVDASYAVEMMNKVRKALTIGGPTFIHSLDPCPKGWDYDPMLSHELGELAVETGIFPLYEVEDGVVRHYGKTKAIVEGRPRKPVREYLLKQGRFAHFTEEDLDYFQSKVDEMWEKWEIPGVIPFWKERPGAASCTAVRRSSRPTRRSERPATRGGDMTRHWSTSRGDWSWPLPLPALVWLPWRPRGGLGADQAHRVRDPGRHRRRRRPDGASHRGHRREAQALAAADHRGQQVGRRGRRGIPPRQGQEGRRPHHHHHPVEPLHHAAAHRRAVQLEGPDPDRPPGARRVHPVGERGDAVQDREGIPRRGQGALGRRPDEDGRDRRRPRKTRSSPSSSSRPPG